MTAKEDGRYGLPVSSVGRRNGAWPVNPIFAPEDYTRDLEVW